jgi:hypothetical protein
MYLPNYCQRFHSEPLVQLGDQICLVLALLNFGAKNISQNINNSRRWATLLQNVTLLHVTAFA